MIIELFNTIFVHPLMNLLVAIYQVLSSLNIPFPLGFAIILLTILIRFVLYPFMASQLRASKKMQDLAPHLSKLKEKHKGDAQRLQAETMLLYKEHGVNPLAGCLPVLIQLPLLFGLYNVLQQSVKQTDVAKINEFLYSDSLKLTHLWDPHFFGIPLAQKPAELFTLMPLIAILPILTGVTQFIQSRMMVVTPSDSDIEKKKKAVKKEPDFASVFQTQTLYLFPIMIGFFSFTFPSGLSLYWITFTIFGIIQQYKIAGWGGMAPLLAKLERKTAVSDQVLENYTKKPNKTKKKKKSIR